MDVFRFDVVEARRSSDAPGTRRIRGRAGIYYTPRETKDDEQRIRDAFRGNYLEDPRSDNVFSVEIRIYTDRKNVDGDNVEKAVMDALSQVLWENDRQIKQMFWVIRPTQNWEAAPGECIWIKALEIT